MHRHPHQYSLECRFAALWEVLRAVHSKPCATHPRHRSEAMIGAHLWPQHICRRRVATQTRS